MRKRVRQIEGEREIKGDRYGGRKRSADKVEDVRGKSLIQYLTWYREYDEFGT